MIRFLEEPFVVSAVSEEHQYLRLNRLRMVSQSLQNKDGKPLDILNVQGPDGRQRITFDLHRFFGESAYMKP